MIPQSVGGKKYGCPDPSQEGTTVIIWDSISPDPIPTATSELERPAVIYQSSDTCYWSEEEKKKKKNPSKYDYSAFNKKDKFNRKQRM